MNKRPLIVLIVEALILCWFALFSAPETEQSQIAARQAA